MAGGGDLTGGGGGGGKTGGGGPSDTPQLDSSGGLSPDMTGLGGPGGDQALAMGQPGFDFPGGGNVTTPSPSNPETDPNVGAPQSQAPPAPGTTPTSLGGVQSGGAQNANVQEVVNSLRGLRAQASPLEQAAAQGQSLYGGGQPGTSTGLQESIPAGTATELQQQQAGGAQRFAPAGAQQQFTQQQQTAAGGAQRYPPPGARPDVGAQQQAAGQAQRYSPTGPDQAAEPPPPPPEPPKIGDTTTAAPAEPTPPTAPAAPASTGPVSSRGGDQTPSGPGGGMQAPQGVNPLKIAADVLRGFLTGDFSGLSQDLQGLAGQTGNQAAGDQGPYGGKPPLSSGGRTPAAAPTTPQGTPATTGSQAVTSLPGGPDGKPPQPGDEQGQRRQEWYKTHDRTDTFPEDQFPERQGPTGGKGSATPGQWGVLPDYAGQPQGLGAAPSPAAAAMTNAQSVAHSRIAGSDTRPTAGFSNYLRNQRAPQATELQNSRTRLETAGMLALENSGDPIGPFESLLNRANYYHQPISRLLHNGFYGPINSGQLQRGIAMYQNNPQLRARIDAAMSAGLAGSNVLAGATDQGLPTDRNGRNPSGRVTRGTEVYNDHVPGAANWRRQQQQRVQQELRGQTPAAPPSPSPPTRGDALPNRTSGRDLLRGYQQVAGLERPGMSPGLMSQAPDEFNPEDRMRDPEHPPETTSDQRYEPSWMTGQDPNLTIQNLDRPDSSAPGS